MRRGKVRLALRYTLLAALSVLFLFPLLVLLTNSFMGDGEVQRAYASMWSTADTGRWLSFTFVPEQATLIQYYTALLRGPGYLRMFWNSVALVVPIVGGQLMVASLAGFGFAKYRFPGRNALFFMFVIVMMMPYQVMIVPSYIAADRLALLGTNWSIILPGVFSAFGVFLMRQFMRAVPDEMLEAARIDGAGTPRVFLRVALPMARNGLVALMVLSFIDNWNMVEQPLIMLSQDVDRPLSVMLSRMNEQQLGIAFAAGMIYLLPALLIYLFCEDNLVAGIQNSGIK